jgi:hypothetical protein
VQRDNPVGARHLVTGAGKPTVRDAQSPSGLRMAKKLMPAAERRRETGAYPWLAPPPAVPHNRSDTGVGARCRSPNTRDQAQAFERLTTEVEGEPRIISDPPLVVPLEELVGEGVDVEANTQGVVRLLRTYRRTFETDRAICSNSSALYNWPARSSAPAASGPRRGSSSSSPETARTPSSSRQRSQRSR